MADGGGHRGPLPPSPPPPQKQNFQTSHPSVKQTQNVNMHFHCFLDNGGHTHVQVIISHLHVHRMVGWLFNPTSDRPFENHSKFPLSKMRIGFCTHMVIPFEQCW